MAALGDSEPAYQGTQVIIPHNISPWPLIICFHGSGESCASWWQLAQILGKNYRVLLYDRGPENPKPEIAVPSMVKYLSDLSLGPPYILIAHSYGGTFAREFLRQHPQDVAGMVLAETGQETVLGQGIEEDQHRRQVLGDKPLSVIRGNSFIAKRVHFDSRLRSARDEAQRQEIRNEPGYLVLETYEKEDEKLKKRQLMLSRNTHYIHVPDCGHDIVRDRPDAVAQELKWVMQNLDSGQRSSHDRTRQTVSFFKRLFKHR